MLDYSELVSALGDVGMIGDIWGACEVHMTSFMLCN